MSDRISTALQAMPVTGLTFSTGIAEPQPVMVDPLKDAAWRELTERSGSVFHSPEWTGVVADTYGFTPQALVLCEGGVPVAGLAWADVDDIRGKRRISMPFCDYAGPIAPTDSHRQTLIDHATQALARKTVSGVVIRAFPNELTGKFISSGSVSVSSWMGIDISDGESVALERISASARKGTRKAERNGVTATLAENKDELRAWFDLHLRVRKYKHTLLAQPFSFFESIWDTFVTRDNGFLVLTWLDGRIVGGMFCLQQGDTVYTKFSASDERSHAAKPNNLLYLKTIRESVERGARLIDMGRNPRSAPGLIYFKQSFGATERDLLSVTHEVEETGSAVEVNHLLSSLTGLLVHNTVPDDVTEAAGRMLYRYFA